MWQQIKANKVKSAILFFVMGLVLISLGSVIGLYITEGKDPFVGIIFAFGFWVILTLVSYFKGDDIFLSMNGARRITPNEHKKLYNIVEEVCIASGMPSVPKIYIIDEQAPNAFAVGKSPKSASVAVTAGLLEKLNRDELQGVIAHEIAHIQNRDTLYMLFASLMLSSIVMLCEGFFRSAGRGSRRSSSGNGGWIILICLIFAILAPIIAELIYFAISRKREYLADACAAQYTRNPQGLANALAKISGAKIKLNTANKYSAPMYIINPLAFDKGGKCLKDLTSTHPSTKSRIKILYKMTGADVVSYQEAYSAIQGKKGGKLFSQNLINNTQPLSIITPQAQEESIDEKIERRREVEDVMWKKNKYIFKVCSCETKIKAPSCYYGKTITCPHCKEEIELK